jgi:pimeloyl-ACP methyl ester carboxylesterase
LIGVKQGYAPVNGLEMYYETHGTGSNPVVLIHGAFSGIGTSFGTVLPLLAETRQVIAVELDGHARTAGSDRPIRVETLASDVVGLLTHLGIERADLFGYSLGAAVALQAAIDHPTRVRKAVLASLGHTTDAMHPGMSEGMDMLQPEMLHGAPFHDEYVALAPKDEFPTLVERIKEFGRHTPVWSAEAIRGIEAPVMVVIGDSDIVRPEGAVDMFRLVGGGVNGDLAGLPASRLAILPATSHTGVAARGAWLAPMVDEFLAT